MKRTLAALITSAVIGLSGCTDNSIAVNHTDAGVDSGSDFFTSLKNREPITKVKFGKYDVTVEKREFEPFRVLEWEKNLTCGDAKEGDYFDLHGEVVELYVSDKNKKVNIFFYDPNCDNQVDKIENKITGRTVYCNRDNGLQEVCKKASRKFLEYKTELHNEVDLRKAYRDWLDKKREHPSNILDGIE